MSLSPVHHASITVTDLDRSLAFYCDVLGLRKTMESPMVGTVYERYLRLAPGTAGRMAMVQPGDGAVGAIELLAFDPPAPNQTGPKRPGDVGVWMVAFEVVGETLPEAHARLTKLGVRFWSDITVVELDGYPPFPMVLFEDPDGTLLELVQLPTVDEARAFRRSGPR